MGEAGGGARVPAQALLRQQSRPQAQPQVKMQKVGCCSSFVSECLKCNCDDEMWRVQG